MDWIGRAWRGEERLGKVFWVYGVLLGLALAVICTVIRMAVAGGIFVYVGVKIIYGIWLWVSLWRCAFNADWKFWGYIVRLLVVLGILLSVLGLLIGSGLVGHDLIVGAECRKELKEYVAKGGTDGESFKRQCIERHLSKGTPAFLLSDRVPPEQTHYQLLCRQAMTDMAQKNKTDSQEYIAQNQAYLQQCMQYYINSDSTATTKAP